MRGCDGDGQLKGRARRRLGRAGLLTAVALGLSGCGWARRGALDPQSSIAEGLLDVFLVSLAVAVVVTAVVLGLWGYAMFHRRGDEDASEGDEDGFPATRFIVIGGLIVPTVILLALMGLTFTSLADQPTEGEVEIRVTGHQFWWEAVYPSTGAVTANEIHIPTGRDVELTLRSDDVIHSFWVPQLGGKVDMIPGRTNTQVLRADEPGTYLGHCAEYCGLQHARMDFRVVAEPPDEYQDWLEHISEPAVVDNQRAVQVFEENGCAGCHTIRGTDADGQLGPDLTHLALREQLAAGAIENTRGNLAGWIADAQSIKPGARMPPIPTMTPEELHVLLDYLESLK